MSDILEAVREIFMLGELQNIIILRDWRKPTGLAEWSVAILGGVIALIGIILALGGVKLIGVGGSWYHLFAGLALIVAGLHRDPSARAAQRARDEGCLLIL